MAYFQVIDKIFAIKPAHGSECIMTPDQDIGIQDDAAKKLSADVILTNQSRVACNGGGGALGHPRVWYEMGDDDFVECKYCDRRFVLIGGKQDPSRAR